MTPKLKLAEETASTCKFWDFRVQEVIIQRFLISEVKHQDFNMDLGDLVASAEQLTAEIDGVRIKIYLVTEYQVMVSGESRRLAKSGEELETYS